MERPLMSGATVTVRDLGCCTFLWPVNLLIDWPTERRTFSRDDIIPLSWKGDEKKKDHKFIGLLVLASLFHCRRRSIKSVGAFLAFLGRGRIDNWILVRVSGHRATRAARADSLAASSVSLGHVMGHFAVYVVRMSAHVCACVQCACTVDRIADYCLSYGWGKCRSRFWYQFCVASSVALFYTSRNYFQ